MSDPAEGERLAQSIGADSPQAAADRSADLKVNLLAEELHVGKETVETGRLRVGKQTHTRDAVVDENLLHERAEIERIPIGRQIFEMPAVRQEGETTIVPIVEEVLFTERRLMLKEELRVTRRRTMEHFQDTVTLRYQEAVITRVQGATDQADATSDKNFGSTDIKE